MSKKFNSGIAFASYHYITYGSHPWFLIIDELNWSYRGRYTCDGMWGVALGVIGAILGISAGCVSDYGTFKSLYIAQSVFVSNFGWSALFMSPISFHMYLRPV